MYVKTRCTRCKQVDYHDIYLYLLRERVFNGSSYRESYKVMDIEVEDTLSEEDKACAIMKELQGYLYNGITTRELCEILKKYFGVAAKYCCDLIARLKIECDMYCPDRRHLYYVDA